MRIIDADIPIQRIKQLIILNKDANDYIEGLLRAVVEILSIPILEIPVETVKCSECIFYEKNLADSCTNPKLAPDFMLKRNSEDSCPYGRTTMGCK